MYSQLAYHVNVAHIEELKRHADHRSRVGGDLRRRRRIDRRLLRGIDRRRVRRIDRRAAGRPSIRGQRQSRQLLDPRV
jgi:hypothetical protein